MKLKIFIIIIGLFISTYTYSQKELSSEKIKMEFIQNVKKIDELIAQDEDGSFKELYVFLKTKHEPKLYEKSFVKLLEVNPAYAYVFGWKVLHIFPWSAGNEAFLYRIGVNASSASVSEKKKRYFDFDLAIECYKKVIEITKTPGNIPVNYRLMAGAYYFNGDPLNGKKAMLNALLSLPPDSPAAEVNSYKRQLQIFEEQYGIKN